MITVTQKGDPNALLDGSFRAVCTVEETVRRVLAQTSCLPFPVGAKSGCNRARSARLSAKVGTGQAGSRAAAGDLGALHLLTTARTLTF
jgi:hypothetical protein